MGKQAPRRHTIKEIKNAFNRNLSRVEQMNKLEKAKMDKTLDTINKYSKYQQHCMNQYMDRLAAKSQAREQNQHTMIKYITNDPTKGSWSEEIINNEGPTYKNKEERDKEQRLSQLLEVCKRNESKAVEKAVNGVDRIVNMTQPFSLPPIKVDNNGTGTTTWLLQYDRYATLSHTNCELATAGTALPDA